MSQQPREQLRTMVRGAYDLQKLRIQMGNRIVGNFKVKLGQQPGHTEEEIDAEGKNALKAMRTAYAKITDGVARFPAAKSFTGDGVISSYTELCLIGQYIDLDREEKKHFRRLKSVLEEFPIYTTWLEKVAGVGPAMAGVIVSEIDIHKGRYPSSLWAYSGLDVAGDGRGRSKRAEHLVEREYTDREGKPARRQGITFNPFLKTKLVGVLGPSFLKVGPEKSPYAQLYYDRKYRLENHRVYGTANEDAKDDKGHKVTSKLRRHNMAIRVIVKQFLADLYNAWRPLEGLNVAPPYSEAKLGMTHLRKAQ